MEGMTSAERAHRRLARRQSIWLSNKLRRIRNIEAGACINESSRQTHGPATHGLRCERCHRVHKHGAAVVRAQELRP